MKKLIDWKPNLRNFFEESKDKKFVFGKWDCVIFTDTAIKAMTGKHLLPKSWKTWKNESEALKSIQKLGKGKGLAQGIDEAIKKSGGLREVPVIERQMGDIVVVKQETEQSLICDGFKLVGPSDSGMRVLNEIMPVEYVKCWRIDG